MKVNNNKLVLNRTEVDKVLMYELERKQFFIEEHTEEIIEGSITSKDVELYTPQDETSNPDKVKRFRTYFSSYNQFLIIDYTSSI